MKKRLTICLILFIGIIFIEKTIPQTSQPEFTIGAFMNIRDVLNRVNPDLYNSFKNTGMNMIVQYAVAENEQYLTDPTLNAKVIAENDDSPQDYITYYSTGFYSKWESEENQPDTDKIGVKHKYGSIAMWDTKDCWSTKEIIGARDSIVYGPHYSQEKKYKRGYQPWGWYNQPVEYSARFRMALEKKGNVSSNENVCVLKVVHRYSKEISQCQYTPVDTVLLQRILTVADFNQNGSFKDFNFDSTYMYDSRFFPLKKAKGQMPEQADECHSYLDIFAGNGIQFCVDWLRNDTLCTLYIDYAEVFDNDGWNKFVRNADTVVNHIRQYTQQYYDWPNLVYWYGHDEPSTIDAIVPMKTVDSLVKFYSKKRVITALTIAAPPYWEVPPYNGEWFHRIFLQNIKPDTLLLNDFPFITNSTSGDVPFRLELSRSKLQELHTYNPDFWYVGQSFGEPTYNRKPDSTELKASIMLALAHGVKGILFWRYDSDSATNYDCIVGSSPDFTPTELYHIIKNNLVPRIKNQLGKTLLGLNYTGHYAFLKRIIPTNELTSQSMDYLTILESYPPTMNEINFHAGLLVSKSAVDNKYFLLANLFTTTTKSCRLSIQSPFLSRTNIRLRNIEGGFDTTFMSSITLPQTLSAGEGKLFQVAPVVKYGGKLIVNETISTPTTLNDDMTIESGATLYINSTYTAKGNITVKDGGKIVGGNNGTIVFADSHHVIIEGGAQINGTANNRLILFYEPTSDAGIKVKQGASLDISYCDIMEAEVGIMTEPYFNSVTIENVNIMDCSGVGIELIGPFNRHSEVTPLIKSCKITSCGFGINAANISELVIMEDSIINCGIGVSVSQVPAAYIIGNKIISTTPEYFGIFMLSSNGNIRGNYIQGHTDGIHLGSSSPDIGENTIINNSEHGIYVGSGSIPNLVAYYAGENPYPYAVSGYNTIMENGNNYFGIMNGDGSEIYLNYSDIHLNRGCNIIADDRTSTPGLPTILLMNGVLQYEHPIYAYGNMWGTIGPSNVRFGNLTVYYTPYNIQPCPFPNIPCNEMQVETSRGEIIDHVIPRNCDTEPVSAIQQSYAEANMLYSTGEVDEARVIYQQITQGQYTTEEKLYAYNKLYTIGNLIDTTNNYFTELQSTFNNLSQTVSDSTLMDVFSQDAILCKVSKEEYVSAINDFDNIIVQNPESEQAVYAEMDIITTALLMDTSSSSLGKVAGGKYFIKGSSDYLTKLGEIIKKNFGKGTNDKANLIPTEFALSQNYPNPFNPTTKIKYQLPSSAQISLKIYDILGREILTLVNEEKPAGYYEVQFNASNLSSGCYFYRIFTNGFVKTMKMMAVK